jgi:hypothetical protein
MSRQDANAFCSHLVPLRRQRRLYRGPVRRYEQDPARSTRSGAISSAPEGRSRPTSARTPRAPPGDAELAAAPRRRLTSALDGNWAHGREAVGSKLAAKAQSPPGAALSDADVLQATRDSVRALMLIRAYRMRGHLHANLDPLGIAKAPRDHRGARSALLWLHRGRLRPQDLPRPRARPRIRDAPRDRRILRAHLLPDARRRVHAHLRSRAEGLDPGAHRGPDKEISFTPEGKPRDPQEADRGRGLREVHATSSTPAPSASASTAVNR